MLHRIAFPDSNAAVCLGFKVEGDTVRGSDLILPAVPLADVASVIVLTDIILAKLVVDPGGGFSELLGKGQDRDLNGSQDR